ncbi:MAG: RsmE family RNA methyltransferase [Verrucomicrobia bacterium]|nr:RsmE family RNA methyltransferase [Verrucomicrobiota bacterium]
MPRFFLTPDAWPEHEGGLPAALTGDEAHHLSQVLRLQSGVLITVFDGAGRRAQAEVLRVSREQVSLKLGEARFRRPALPVITLAQAIPKGKHMDLIVRQAVELGIATIQPLVTRHTIVQPGERRSEKWRRIALEACKQCGQDVIPAIPDPLPFDRWLAAHAGAATRPGLMLIASLAPGARPLREVLHEHPGTTHSTLLVGPEGDFSPAETTAALAAGFLPVSLGEIVLRVETAALCCLSALRYEFGLG